MKRSAFLLLIIFVFLSLNSWGQSNGPNGQEPNWEKIWDETGFNFDILFGKLKPGKDFLVRSPNNNAKLYPLNAETCFKSEKFFNACMIALSELVRTSVENEHHQIKVSESNEFKILPLPKEELPDSIEALSRSKEKLREYFRPFYQKFVSSKDNKVET